MFPPNGWLRRKATALVFRLLSVLQVARSVFPSVSAETVTSITGRSLIDESADSRSYGRDM